MNIQILSPDVVDQIAAGEVVERPAHLVKELVENSLDAGATHVQVEYSEGGRRVKVIDDGCGIPAAELALALERFATSKIRSSDDIWSLQSFGFRGEALASLAAVSRLTMTSRTASEATASQLISEFGKKSAIESVGGAPGTTMLVEDLFGNIPARLKFLKTEVGEHAQIRSTLKALALSRPDVEFRFHENGRLTGFYPIAASPRVRAEQVLEVSPLFEGSAERENVKAFAVFAPPSEVARTSRNIWLFAQNRWVQDRGMQAAVGEAYRSLLMHGEYPIAAIWVTTDPSEVDVNIHPTKSQVKFRDNSLVFRAVQASLRSSLEKAPWLPAAEVREPSSPPASVEAVFGSGATSAANEAKAGFVPSNETLRFDDPALQATVFAKKQFDFGQVEDRQRSDSLASNSTASSRPSTKSSGPALPNFAPTMTAVAPTTTTGPWSSLDVLGQANLTYMVCQSEKGLVLVDQHAAHERVAFERLMNAWKGGRIDVQEFLFPIAVELPPEKVEALSKAMDDLGRLGLSVELLGPGTVGVRAGPALLKDSVYARVLEKTANDIDEKGGSFSFEKIVGDLCATMACHSVVRAGQALSLDQMRQLLREMDEFPLSSFCPHGRPVSVEIGFTRLEKDFGRIV